MNKFLISAILSLSCAALAYGADDTNATKLNGGLYESARGFCNEKVSDLGDHLFVQPSDIGCGGSVVFDLTCTSRPNGGRICKDADENTVQINDKNSYVWTSNSSSGTSTITEIFTRRETTYNAALHRCM